MYKLIEEGENGTLLNQITVDKGAPIDTMLTAFRRFLEISGYAVLTTEEVVLYDFQEPRKDPSEPEGEEDEIEKSYKT